LLSQELTGKNPCKTDCLAGAQNLQIYSHNLHKSIILAAQHPIITWASEEIWHKLDPLLHKFPWQRCFRSHAVRGFFKLTQWLETYWCLSWFVWPHSFCCTLARSI